MNSGEETALPSVPSTSSKGERPELGVAVDLDSHTGLKSPPAKRAKLSESPDGDSPSPSNEWVTEEEDGEEGSSEEGSQSPDSFILDLFHAEGSGEPLSDDIKITKEEAEALKTELRTVGGANFMRKYVCHDSGFSVNELLYAFGYVLPEEFEFPPETLLGLLRMAVESELRKRKKLDNVNTIDDVVNLIQTSNNIIALVGAGISTSCGIPDFRSDTGIYAMLSDWGLDDPHDMFDIEVFRNDPRIFYSFARQVLPSTTAFSPTHAFLRLLQDKNKLLRVYTQNIDNLEQLAGVGEDKLVQCHGSFATASCMRCKLQVSGDEIREDVINGVVPKCPACEAERGRQQAQKKSSLKKRKRNADWDDDDEDEDDNIIEGIMKVPQPLLNVLMTQPDITFFGEQLSKKFDYTLLGSPAYPDSGDVRKCDLLICIGTSLKVAPVSELIGVLPASVPQIYISKTQVTHIEFDTTFLGNCDDIIRDLVRRCGYILEHEKLEGGRSDIGEGIEWKEHQTGVYEIISEGNTPVVAEASAEA